jgi:hypothetical protein
VHTEADRTPRKSVVTKNFVRDNPAIGRLFDAEIPEFKPMSWGLNRALVVLGVVCLVFYSAATVSTWRYQRDAKAAVSQRRERPSGLRRNTAEGARTTPGKDERRSKDSSDPRVLLQPHSSNPFVQVESTLPWTGSLASSTFTAIRRRERFAP